MPSDRRPSAHVVPADADNVAAAAACLRGGGLVAMPTETVYGLAADATSDARGGGDLRRQGAAALQSADRPFRRRGERGARGDLRRRRGAARARFWPGPLTLVVPVAADCRVSLLARAGLDSLALRVPAHPVARALIARGRRAARRAFGQPLGARQPDARRARRGRPRRPRSTGSSTPGRRRSGSNRRLSPASAGRRGCCARARSPRERDRGRARRRAGRRRRAGARRAARAGAAEVALRAARRGCGSRRRRRRRTRRRSISPARSPAAPRAPARPVAGRRPRRGGGESVRLPARARRERRRDHRRRAGPRPRPGRGDQRPPAPRRRAARSAEKRRSDARRIVASRRKSWRRRTIGLRVRTRAANLGRLAQAIRGFAA